MEIREHYSVDDMRAFTKTVLLKRGYSEEAADATTYALLEADIRGIFSHGIAGGTGLEEAVKRAGITATLEIDKEPIQLESKYPSIVVINGNGAPGHITAMRAVKLVKELARKYGIAKVVVNNTNHYGAAGVWSHLIAQDGDLKGDVSCTTIAVARVMGDDSDRLDYTKGAGSIPRLGTNPIAISFPIVNGQVLTLDMATTRMAVSYGLKHLKAGTLMDIPEYFADSNYKSTFDPRECIDNTENLEVIGSVFPFGSTLAGYKGDGLIRFLEIDQALGGGPITRIPLGGSGNKRRISHSFTAQVIDFHYSKVEGRQRIRALMDDYEQYFGEYSRWPGERSDQAIAYARENGIPYSKGQVDTIRRAANEVGLVFEDLIKPVSTQEYPEEIFNK
ncbi:MAG: Ldh family oxidoreductase [Candidatus Heimdallarchaeota archaeon]|nr:Ldh family oxidoreductase [Candidatus Heimdallarchaeota archaeon]